MVEGLLPMPIKWNVPWKLGSTQGSHRRFVTIVDCNNIMLINCGVDGPENVIRAMLIVTLVNELFETDEIKAAAILEGLLLELERFSGPSPDEIAEAYRDRL